MAKKQETAAAVDQNDSFDQKMEDELEKRFRNSWAAMAQAGDVDEVDSMEYRRVANAYAWLKHPAGISDFIKKETAVNFDGGGVDLANLQWPAGADTPPAGSPQDAYQIMLQQLSHLMQFLTDKHLLGDYDQWNKSGGPGSSDKPPATEPTHAPHVVR